MATYSAPPGWWRHCAGATDRQGVPVPATVSDRAPGCFDGDSSSNPGGGDVTGDGPPLLGACMHAESRLCNASPRSARLAAGQATGQGCTCKVIVDHVSHRPPHDTLCTVQQRERRSLGGCRRVKAHLVRHLLWYETPPVVCQWHTAKTRARRHRKRKKKKGPGATHANCRCATG